MMLAVHAATAAPQQPAGLYRTICDTAHRPLTWLAQGTTGTHSAFALKCSLGDPAFHWHATCNTKQRPVAYTVLRQLQQCHEDSAFRVDATTTRGITQRLPVLDIPCDNLTATTWADAMDAALRRDCGAGVSLFDAPFHMARPYTSGTSVLGTQLRNPRDWALSRIATFPQTLICEDARYGLNYLECARACRRRKVSDCFVRPTYSALVAAYEQDILASSDVKAVAAPLPKVALTIATVVNDEAIYILEWIAYHALRGVERFIIYDNNSSDSLRSTLSPHLESGVVILEDATSLCHMPRLRHPDNHLAHNFSAQQNSMMHAVFTYGASTVHMATIDVDEFLDSPNATLVPALPKRGHVLLQWSPLSPFDGVKGTPILSSRWSAMQLAGRQDLSLIHI